MATVLKQLGQLTPANTTAASLYSPAANTETIIKSIIICNTGNTSNKYRIFHDAAGTTYDESTALFWDIQLNKESTEILEFNLAMNGSTGNLAIRTDSADDLTFTCYGAEIT